MPIPTTTIQRRGLTGLLVCKAVYGTALLTAAPLVAGRAARFGVDRRARWAAGAIGARNLAEVAIICKRPTRSTVAVVAAIDITHAASMLLVAVARPSRWRLATASGLTAALIAGTALTAARRLPQHGRREA